MENRAHSKEKGQILIFVAIALVAMMAILALVLDGGNTYSKRRAAQNAADAGALAGARTLCITKDASQAASVAYQYATSHNSASDANVNIDALGYVTVTARIDFKAFFAQIIGRPDLTAEATASAGCFPPSKGSVLPIAWACRPPINPNQSDSPDCEEERLTDTRLAYYIANPVPITPTMQIYPELYIVMDSSAQPDDLAAICMSQGGWLQCDLDGDGNDDLIANGDRSWLDLNGSGGGSSELIDWINGVSVPTIYRHTWLGGQSGVANNVFQAAATKVGQIVGIPVFDEICDDYPDPRCSSMIHPQDTLLTSAGGSYFYHVISFAAFYISCVDAPGVPGPECAGHKVATDLGVIANNTKTIEGYFVQGILPNLGGGDPNGIDLGVYTLRLYR